MEVLLLLAERHGELVSPEDLARRLWSDGVVLDRDAGLHTAILTMTHRRLDSWTNQPRECLSRCRQNLREQALVCRVHLPTHDEGHAGWGIRFLPHFDACSASVDSLGRLMQGGVFRPRLDGPEGPSLRAKTSESRSR